MSKIQLQDLRLDNRRENLKKLSGKEFSLIEKFINEAKNGEHNGGTDIKEATERKYIDALSMAYKTLKKPLLKTTKEDLTKLKQDLKSGKIKSRNKKPYSPSSQREMELVLIRFLEYVKPDKYAGFRKWFVVKTPKKDVEYLKESEIEKLYKSCKSNEERFLIAVLFDGGLRASEFLNVRFEDITEPTQGFPYYRVNIKEEYSKTKGRKIGMYWKHSTDAIRDYLSNIPAGEPKDPVYTKTYDAVRIFLTRLGKKVLNKRIYFHIFRKSSATYYAPIIKSRQQLCYRYGWQFSSDVPDVYINREMGEEMVKEDVKQVGMQKLELENQELKTKLGITNDKIEVIEKTLDPLASLFAKSLESPITRSLGYSKRNSKIASKSEDFFENLVYDLDIQSRNPNFEINQFIKNKQKEFSDKGFKGKSAQRELLHTMIRALKSPQPKIKS